MVRLVADRESLFIVRAKEIAKYGFQNCQIVSGSVFNKIVGSKVELINNNIADDDCHSFLGDFSSNARLNALSSIG
jgi:hypothetical protein